ncbi:MAG: large-conductance mechanosensitive channel protein MscL [Sphaerochaeta sp.]|nr:large-conductance mechanosensitive channel protein MscL [Sphaerochaeta sp.]MDD4301883.1 large-conductance mechanosensitive channel protein MscL [Sphaerochaeta sp.]MDD4647995.1 large-conductance mechanosensitive channel protein MscL [Sphaerochaeta sp.]
MGMIAEFKKFITRGNVIDMAVGIIIGTAFKEIINSLVKEIIMPLIGLFLGGISFVDLKIVIAEATEQTTEVAIMYGNFIQRIIDFLIIAFVVFMMVRTINRIRERIEARKKAEAAAEAEAAPPAPTPADIVLLSEIRDLLKK